MLTDQGRLELTAVWRYVSSPAYALFSANRSQEFAKVSYAAEQAMIAVMELDPTLGLFSATAASQGPLAQDALLSGVSDIIQGRRPLTDLDGLVADWRTKAGDKMRGEFQDAIAAARRHRETSVILRRHARAEPVERTDPSRMIAWRHDACGLPFEGRVESARRAAGWSSAGYC